MIPAPSPLSELTAALDDEEGAEELSFDGEPTLVRALPKMPEVPPLTDFELDTRRRLADIESHLARSDGIIMALQLEQRQLVQGLRADFTTRFAQVDRGIRGLAKSLRELAALLRPSNGHAGGGPSHA